MLGFGNPFSEELHSKGLPYSKELDMIHFWLPPFGTVPKLVEPMNRSYPSGRAFSGPGPIPGVKTGGPQKVGVPGKSLFFSRKARGPSSFGGVLGGVGGGVWGNRGVQILGGWFEG